MSGRRRIRVQVVGILVLAGVLAFPAAPAVPAATHRVAVIDSVLESQVASLGFAPAILTWDRTQVDRTQVAAYLEAQGVEAHVLEGLSIAFSCAATAADLDILAGAPGAVSVWGDRPLHPALDQSVRTAFNGDPNNIWQGLGVTGKGVAIGVVDTGVDGTHPDLQYGTKTKLNVRVVVSNREILGPNDPCLADSYSEQVRDSELTSGHGTHIASVAAGDGTVSGGRYRGVAPGADIIGVGVADTLTPQASVDQGVTISLLGALAGINYVSITGLEGCSPPHDPINNAGQANCDHFIPVRAKVILAGWTQHGLYDPWHPMTFAIRDLAWYGITVVFPVGNEGSDTSDCSAAATCHINPFAVSPNAIGVAATPKRSRTALESYSSRGDPLLRQSRGEAVRYEPMLAAPGTNVVAARRAGLAPYVQPPGSILGAGPASMTDIGADRRYVAMSGTSISAAHVAGAIALMQEAAVKAKGCYLTTTQVTSILRSTATPMLGYQSWEVGAGALDVTAAVYAARSAARIPSLDPWMCPPNGS